MRLITKTLLLVSLVFLSGCRSAVNPITAPAALQTPTSTTPPLASATSEPLPEPSLTAPKPVPTATETPVATPAAAKPTLFEVEWADRESYLPGLINAQRDSLENLIGAPVYHMHLEIEHSLRIVQGKQEIRYTNLEHDVLSDLYFHLFPNLLGGSISVKETRLDGMPVTSRLELNGAVMRLPLAAPLPPGGQVTLYMEFTTEVPTQSVANFGIFVLMDDILALAHFYPMLAVFDDEGWNIKLPVPGGDIVYSDIGFYLVEVTAPAEVVIAAGGIERSRENAGDKNRIVYAAGPARDFYLSASAKYQVRSVSSGETVINSFSFDPSASANEIVLESVTSALDSFGHRFGPYPYTELDVVSTPLLALGVEYPGIFAVANRIYSLDDPENGTLNRILLESTTAHETAHQWFYGLVGSDQLDEPWLDESLTQYATWLYYVDRYGFSNSQGFYQSLLDRWGRVDNAEIPIGLPVSAYEENEYVPIIYGRGPIFVHELAQRMGQDTFDNFLKAYSLANKWDIATTAGFKQLAELYCRCDLTGMFDAWVYQE